MDPNSAVIIVAAIGIVTALIGIVTPILTAILSYKQAGHVLKANADAADRAADAAQKAAEKAELAAVKVETVRTDLQVQGASVDKKLDSIHALVNSQLTEAVGRLKDAVETIRQGDERFKAATATIDALRDALVRAAPDDPRVKEIATNGVSKS